jgi:hypothetical protein
MSKLLIFFAGLSFWGLLLWGLSRVVTLRAQDPRSQLSFSALFITLVGAFLILVPHASLGGEFRISDSLQYCWGAKHLVDLGAFTIPLNNSNFPSRFTPWFSLFVIAPTYLFTPRLEYAIIPIVALSMLCLVLALAVGSRIAHTKGSIFAILGLFSISGFRYFSENIMTEVPTTALYLLQLAIWLTPRKDLATAVLTGSAIALGGSFRPTMLATLPLFLWRHRSSIGQLSLIIIPTILLTGANLAYNSYTFDSPLRSGYHYWVSVPYDYLTLTFHPAYLASNIQRASSLFQLCFLATLVAIGINIFKRQGHKVDLDEKYFGSALVFAGFSSLPQVLFYLFYFYSSDRFYLPCLLVLMVVAAPALAAAVKFSDRSVTVLASLLLVGLGMFQGMPETPVAQELRKVASSIPDDAVIISARDPLLIEYYLVGSTQRSLLPYSRDVEFASKIITPHKIDLPLIPPPDNAFDHRTQALVNRNDSIDPFPSVALEALDTIKSMQSQGTQFYLDIRSLSDLGVDPATLPDPLKDMYLEALQDQGTSS